jgi:hypothetical protein
VTDIVRKKDSAPMPAVAAQSRPQGSLDANMQFRVRASTLEGQKKTAHVWADVNGQRSSSTWIMQCDEGLRLGGEDSAPSPLSYFSAAIAF